MLCSSGYKISFFGMYICFFDNRDEVLNNFKAAWVLMFVDISRCDWKGSLIYPSYVSSYSFSCGIIGMPGSYSSTFLHTFGFEF